MANETQSQRNVEIVRAEATSDALAPKAEDLLQVIEARNRLVERLLSYAISATHPGQWTKLGDKPWPTGPACEAMARRCGVSWDEPKAEKRDTSDEQGPAYTWTYRARFFLPSGIDSIWAEGHCSSRDQFLGTGHELDDETGDYKTRTLSEVEEGNIRQAAMTNMIVNGVTRLLGVRNLSFERLDALLGKGASESMAKVSYDAGAKGGGRGKSSEDVEIKFGKGKGKHLSELPDDDVRFYMSCWEKDLADPEKAKYHKFSKSNLEVAQKLLAARANAAQGVQGNGGAAGAQPTVWHRILALPEAKGMAPEAVGALLKTKLGKANAKDLVEADIEAVRSALAQANDQDIKF